MRYLRPYFVLRTTHTNNPMIFTIPSITIDHNKVVGDEDPKPASYNKYGPK